MLLGLTLFSCLTGVRFLRGVEKRKICEKLGRELLRVRLKVEKFAVKLLSGGMGADKPISGSFSGLANCTALRGGVQFQM